MMGRLPHLHLSHPIKNLAGIEIAKNAALELQQQGRMNGVTEIQQCIGAGQSVQQIASADSKTAHLLEIMPIIPARLIKQTISFRQTVGAQLCLKTVDCSSVGLLLSGCRKNFQPDGIEVYPAQPKHPLQWHRQNPASSAILRVKPAAEKYSHAIRIARVGGTLNGRPIVAIPCTRCPR